MKQESPARHRGLPRDDVEALAAYRATSRRVLVVQVVAIFAVGLALTVWLGPAGAVFLPVLGATLAPYVRGRRLARRRPPTNPH